MTDNLNNNINADPLFKQADNGIIWFICFLPLIGLFLENYANSKYIGAVLWILIILIMPVCCFADSRKLKSCGFNATAIAKWSFCAPIYVCKREKLIGRDVSKAVMMMVFIIAALFLNGFTQGLRVNTEVMTESVKNSQVQSLDNFNGSSGNIIGEQIESYFGESAQWSGEKLKNRYDITVKGTHDNDNIEIEFQVKYDGFISQGALISKIKVNGKTLSEDEFKDLLRKIFIPETIENKSDNISSNAE